jgi:hypothetical protein
MSRSLGIISASFALKRRALALVGHVVFYLFGGPFPSTVGGVPIHPFFPSVREEISGM